MNKAASPEYRVKRMADGEIIEIQNNQTLILGAF